MASERRSQFPFIKRGHSVRTKDKKPREEEGALSRWLRELRGGSEPKPSPIDRSNPVYHSEGKGVKSKRPAKEKRRHSFNQRPHQSQHQIRCCVEREDEGRGSDRLAMTGGAPKSPNYIINPSDQGHRVKGHEKGASWGGEDPQPLRQPRANSFTQQLKTVMERCEKMTPGDKFLPKVDRDGKHLGDNDYSIPSPPERDLDHFSKYNETRLSQLSIDGGYDGSQTSLTRAELEQYTRAYEDVRPVSHSQQPSYAQSEGYHSYVSSADSTSTTPFLDRLRRDNIDTSCMVGISSSSGGRESSASSGSSSETLKWHGSMSDVSSSAGGHSGSHSSHSGGHTTPHIAHSARVPMPQRHHSESVLYLDPSSQHHQNNINSQMRRLFPVTTYEPTSPRHLIESYSPSSSSRSQPKLSVAERVCEIERQTTRPLPPQPTTDHSIDKRSSRLPDHAALKAMQKKALLSFYERHHSAWKSEPQLTTPSMSSLPTPGPPQPPPRAQPPLPVPASRRSSSASDYAGAVKREIPRSHLDLSKVESNGIRESKHQHSSSCGSLTTAALGPMIVGPAISVDDWVPARPPKKPHLRGAPTVYQQRPPPLRVASPEPPPPSPPAVTEDEILYNADEPLPPPPPEEFLIHRPASLSKHEKARFERAMNASMSLDNLTRSDGKPPPLLLPKSPVHQDTSPGIRPHQDTSASRLDGYYENGSDLKHSHKNGFIEKFNERYVENRIESMQSNYADSLAEIWDKKSPPGYVEMRRFDKKMQPLEPPERHAPRHAARLTSPPLPLKGKRPYNSEHQPRSLDSSGLSIVERQNEVNRPGPQTPVSKKYNHQGLSKNASERQSLRFTTSSQKLVVNGKIAVAVQNGKISPTGPVTSRKANLARTPSDAAYGNHSNHGLHRAQPVKSPPAATPESPKPALPPHCPPTSLQLSQSKASYLSYKREPKEKEKGLPNFQGSYKRTMSPNGARITDSDTCLSELTKSCSDLEIKSRTTIAPIDCDDVPPEKTDVRKPPVQPQADAVVESRENLSKTLPRNYSLATTTPAPPKTSTAATMTTAAKRTSRPPRAQSDPTSSAKVEKKNVAVSASTQDNLDEEGHAIEDGVTVGRGAVVLVGRSQSDRTGEGRSKESKMSDAASQTTPAPSPSPPPQSSSPSPSVVTRRPLQEEIECDRLSRDLASQLSPSHKLHGILVPGPEVKRTTDYVSGLFRMDFAPRSRNSISSLPPNSLSVTSNGTDSESLTSSGPTSYPTCDRNSRLTSTAPPTTSPSMSSLQQKKHELMLRLSQKLNVLRSESVAVNEEISVNEALGLTVTERIEKLARPQEVAKFRLHVKEVGHITSLLLSLSGRLARAENALLTLAASHQDRKMYEEKRDKLLCQLNEAKQLKSNIDQRSNNVSSMLYNYLTGEEYTDYDHFINMKSKLLVDSREIAEKIQLGEEQLSALKETLDQVR